MTKDQIVKKFKKMPWEVWLHRRFSPFVTYLMMTHATPRAYKEQGVDGQFPLALYDTDDWYGTEEMFNLAGARAERYLKKVSIFKLTKQCENILARGRKEIPRLVKSSADPLVLFERVLNIIKPANLYIWIAHGSEVYYYKKLRALCRGYVKKENLDKYIGDVIFPSKKNSLARMHDDILKKKSTKELFKKYAWIKSRGGFAPGYTTEEIEEIKNKILAEKESKHKRPAVPKEIKSFVKETRELVYLRTLRTDALYEMYYLAQPIFDHLAKKLGIASVKDYIPDELLAGKFKKVPHEYAIIKYNEEVIVLRESIISTFKVGAASEVKGIVAQKGFAKGTARLLYTPIDASKVKKGDVIITNMTTPAFIAAMNRAAAFVTNEGGITCHAAIIAREMKKPCIIGAKIATKIFKDGDMVEVDAERGVVRKL